MKPIHERTLPAWRMLPSAASWYGISAAWLSVAVVTMALVQQNLHLAAVSRVSEGAASISSRSDDVHDVRGTPTVSAPSDFVDVLPGLIDPDATIRFTSRLAQGQEVRVSQMQSQSIATDAKQLGQTIFTMQLRGDYPNIKNVVIGLLAKFPGLTLQHLTIHHRDATPGNPANQGSDEATLELIQFIRPVAIY